MSIEKIIEGLETKEGLMLLIQQMINDNPNDADLGKVVRKNLKNYLEEEVK